jgi:hypothetical protein
LILGRCWPPLLGWALNWACLLLALVEHSAPTSNTSTFDHLLGCRWTIGKHTGDLMSRIGSKPTHRVLVAARTDFAATC